MAVGASWLAVGRKVVVGGKEVQQAGGGAAPTESACILNEPRQTCKSPPSHRQRREQN